MSAILMAGLDGIKIKSIPPNTTWDPLTTRLCLERREESQAFIYTADLAEAMQALKDDHDFLLAEMYSTKNLLKAT
jgi:glutamine synthetase